MRVSDGREGEKELGSGPFVPHLGRLTGWRLRAVLCGPSAEKAFHEIQVAPGADLALSICCMAAMQLANDELFKPRQNDGNSLDD